MTKRMTRERLDDGLDDPWSRRRRVGRVKDAPAAVAEPGVEGKVDRTVEGKGKPGTRRRVDDRKRFPQPERGGGLIRPGTGRPPGATNYVTWQLKAGILSTAERVGFDGKGRDGLIGYLQRLALYEPATFGGLLRRIMPLQVKTDLDPDGLAARLIQTIAARRQLLANGSGSGGGNVIDVTPEPDGAGPPWTK